jgi:hypothetical protein
MQLKTARRLVTLTVLRNIMTNDEAKGLRLWRKARKQEKQNRARGRREARV